MKILIRAILAGMSISIGGIVYLMSSNKIIGASLFFIGLFLVLSFEYNLYTGKVGYLVFNNIKYLKELMITLVGNFIGSFLVARMITLTRLDIIDNATTIVSNKLNDNLLSIFILSLFCGILMFVGVNGFKTIDNSVGKYIAPFLAVVVFILSGFEHCVANMFYFSLTPSLWSFKMLLYLGIMILGNTLGSILIASCTKYTNNKIN